MLSELGVARLPLLFRFRLCPSQADSTRSWSFEGFLAAEGIAQRVSATWLRWGLQVIPEPRRSYNRCCSYLGTFAILRVDTRTLTRGVESQDPWFRTAAQSISLSWCIRGSGSHLRTCPDRHPGCPLFGPRSYFNLQVEQRDTAQLQDIAGKHAHPNKHSI